MPDAGKDAEEIVAYCWHCDRAPRAENQILCNDCLEDAASELAAFAPAHLEALNALQQQLADVTAERDARAFDADTLDDLYHKALDALADVRQERDRYREALLEIRAMASVAGYDAGHEGIYSRARAALTPGAKGETDGE